MMTAEAAYTSEVEPEAVSPTTPGVTVSRQSTFHTMRALVRNPIEAFPPEVFREKVVLSRVGRRTVLILCDPALIHELFVTRFDSISKGTVVPRSLGFALGESLLTAEGAHWRWQRAAAAPAFTHQKLLRCLPAMLAAAEATRDRWLSGDGTVRVGHEMTVTTFDIIVHTMLSGPGASANGGLDVARAERSVAEYLAATPWITALDLIGAPRWVPYPGRRRTLDAARYLRQAMLTMVQRRRQGGPDDDLVALLLAAADPADGRAMTDQEVADNLLTFISAGHETTAVGLTWTLHLLARHPDIEARLLEEVRSVTGGAELTPEHVPKLAYTRQVFQESMRLFPPQSALTRTALQPFQLGSFTVPAGTILYVPVHALHRHIALWDRPDRFDPDRFAPDQVASRHRYAYMPFGAGPRTCIGMVFSLLEAQAILGVLLPAIRLTQSSRAMPQPVMRLALRPDHDAPIQIEPR